MYTPPHAAAYAIEVAEAAIDAEPPKAFRVSHFASVLHLGVGSLTPRVLRQKRVIATVNNAAYASARSDTPREHCRSTLLPRTALISH